MSSAGYTPGPWAVEDPMDFELSIVEANKPTHEWRFIASIALPDPAGDDFTMDEVKANATLIAASPAMVEALQEFVREYDGFENGDGDPCPTLAKAKAVLSLALGDSSLSGGG